MKIDPLAEGLDDYALEREEADTREQMLYWATAMASPCCRDCGYLAYAKHELLAATRRARAIGVFDEQPKRGLAKWGSTPPRDVAGRLLYPQRIYITDVGRTLAKMCP